jgi:hypothetical protein
VVGSVPRIITDIGIVAGVFTAVVTAVAVFWRTPPVCWFRRHLSESLGEWIKERVTEASSDHYEYVRYHLGPNGDTKPIHARLQDVERAVGQPKFPCVDWNGPYDEDDAT